MRRFSKHKQWVRVIVAAALLALLATSCIKVEADITVEDDGSGEVDFLTALDTESLFGVLAEMDLPEEAAGSTDDLCSEFAEDSGNEGFPADAQIEAYEEDGFCGSRVSYSLQASSDQSLAIEPLFDGDARLFKDGDNWFFDVPVDLSEVTDDSGELPDEMFESILGDASFVVSLDLPGRAVAGENNADSVGDDGQFEWDIDFLNPPQRLFAQTEPGSGGGTSGGGFPWWILGLVALLAIAGIGAWWFMNRGEADDAASSLDGYPSPQGDLGTPGADVFGGAQQRVDVPPPAAGTPQNPASTPQQFGAPAGATPVTPANPAAQETVMFDTSTTAAAGAGGAAAGAGAAAGSAKPVPVFDEALGAWIVNHPEHGRLVHDPDTDTWRPA